MRPAKTTQTTEANLVGLIIIGFLNPLKEKAGTCRPFQTA